MKKILTITSCSIFSLALNISEIKAERSPLEQNMLRICNNDLFSGTYFKASRLMHDGKMSEETFNKINEELERAKAIYRANRAQVSSTTEMCKAYLERINKLLSEAEIAKPLPDPWRNMLQECGRNSHSAFANALSLNRQGHLSDETFNRMLKDLGGREAILKLSRTTSTSDLKKDLAASTAESNAKKCRDAVDKVNGELLNGIIKPIHERSMKEFDAMKLEISEKVSRFKKEGKISDETFNIIVNKIEYLTKESRMSYGPGFLVNHKRVFEEIDEFLKTESANPGGDKTPCARPIFINTIDGAFTCLGLPPNASWDEVDGAYNKLLKSEPYHSLSETGKKQRLKKLGEAYRILKFQKFNLGPKYRGDL